MDAKISYVIPYKHNIERFLNLNRVLDWLYSIPLDMEVIIVEQLDIESKFKNNLGTKVYGLNNN